MASDAYQELLPPLTEGEPATELLRAAITDDGALMVSLIPAFDDPGSWGLLLVDLARHVARAYAAEELGSEEDVLAQVTAIWDAELASPTDLGETGPHKDFVQ